jgi:hypothetical protein
VSQVSDFRVQGSGESAIDCHQPVSVVRCLWSVIKEPGSRELRAERNQ